MEKTFTKSQNLVLIALGLIGGASLMVSLINNSDRYIFPAIALICFFLLGIYRNFLKNKRFINANSKIFILYNQNQLNKFNIILFLVLAGVVIFTSIYKFSFYGLFVGIGLIIYIAINIIFFPYRNGTLIMINDTAIYSFETGFIELNEIEKYSFKDDLMLLNIELKNNQMESIEYNKFLDLESFKKELELKLES